MGPTCAMGSAESSALVSAPMAYFCFGPRAFRVSFTFMDVKAMANTSSSGITVQMISNLVLPSIGAPSLSSYLPARLNSSTQPITPVQPKKMKEPMPVSRANRSSTYAAALEACGGNQL